MKHERLYNCLVGGILAFFIACSSVLCLGSGYSLDAEPGAVALFCLVLAAICAGCFYIPRGSWVLLGAGALILGYLWHNGDLTVQFRGLLFELTTRYNNAYGTGVYGAPAGDLTGVLECFAAVMILSVSWAVCCRKTAAPAVAAALVPLGLCLVVTDSVPEIPYLYGLFFSLTLLIMTNHLRRQDLTQSIRLSWMLAVPLALALGLLFALVPQEGYDKQPYEIQTWILDTLSEMPDSFDGLAEDVANRLNDTPRGDRVNLSNVGPQNQRDNPVLDVVAPRTGVLYLREQDYDHYDGTSWTASTRRQEEFSPPPEWSEAGTVTIATRRSRELLLLPYYPESWELQGGSVENDDGLSSYEMTQYTLPGNWHSIATSGSGYDSGIRFVDGTRYDGGAGRYLVLPGGSRTELEFLVDRILTDEVSATQIAESIAAYVRGSATYDLKTRRMPGDEADFVLWFLNRSDTGYCVHFATATAVLLRAAGVESRYVTGYMVSVRAGEPVTVTGGEAHAWVEYYEPRLDAWIVLESTPSDLTDPPEVPTEGETTAPTEALPPEQTEPPVRLDEEPPDPGEKDGFPDMTWVIYVLAALCILGTVLALPTRRWIYRCRCRKKSSSGPNAHALVLWTQAEAQAAYLKTKLSPELEALAQKARFSQHTLTEEELEAMESTLAALTEQCREKNPLARMVQKYWYLLY